MGLTEGHWFEDENQLSERQLEMAIEDEKVAYERGFQDGLNKNVNHGRWKYEDGDPQTIPCSVCSYRVFRWNNTKYCPNCGAIMDLEGKSEK